MLAVAIPAGVLIGLALGALGGGGSILTVPALVYLLDQSPHEATAGSLLIVGITALAGMLAHWRSGRVRVAQGVVFGVLGIAGSYAGSRLSAHVDPNVLLTAFAVLIVVAALAMLRRRRGPAPHPAPADPVGPAPRPAFVGPSVGGSSVTTLERAAPPKLLLRVDRRRAVKVVAAATVVGLLTGFFGVGGGFVIVPALVLVLGFEMPVAVGTSLLVIAINSTVALGVRLGGNTTFDWPLLGVFTATAIVGSFVGNRVASKVDARSLTTAFAVLLVGVAVYTAARSVPHLL